MKERLNEAFRLYFILVTLITILLLVLGMLFDSDRTLGYDAYLSPLIYAAIGVVPYIFLGADKELSMKRMLVRRLIKLLFIETVVLVIAFSASTIPTERTEVVIGIAVGIVVVFVLSIVIEYIIELGNSKKLNEALYRYQERDAVFITKRR